MGVSEGVFFLLRDLVGDSDPGGRGVFSGERRIPPPLEISVSV